MQTTHTKHPFDQFGLEPVLLRAVYALGYEAPTPIHKEAIPAAPGRLLDHMSRRNVDFRGLQVLVLDEADRMLDMGFLPDVRRIVDALPRDRQTLLFSATMLPEIEVLSRTIMRNPARISVSPPHRPPTTIRHEVYPVPQHLKTSLLVRLLGRESMMSVLVFVIIKLPAVRVARQVGQ